MTGWVHHSLARLLVQDPIENTTQASRYQEDDDTQRKGVFPLKTRVHQKLAPPLCGLLLHRDFTLIRVVGHNLPLAVGLLIEIVERARRARSLMLGKSIHYVLDPQGRNVATMILK